MTRLRFASLALAGGVSLAAVQVAGAGGFDRGGINIDQLFDAAPFSAEAGVTYVSPRRTLKNVQRQDSPPFPVALSSSSVEIEGDHAVPYVGFKVNVIDPVDCLATYTEPYGADADFGRGNAYSPTTVEFSVGTRDLGLTCSYKMQLGKGVARIIGGVSYGEVDTFLSRQTLLAFGNPGLARFELSDSAWSWRVGGAYEIPEIALRATLLYSAKYDYDDLSGSVDTTGLAGAFPADLIPGSTGVRSTSASAEIPQALELRLQSGIAPGWLAFGSVRWQDWSKLDIIPVQGVVSPVDGSTSPVSFDPLYRDGWTVTGGVGHQFTDMIFGAAALTWDRGTSTSSGYQTDTWTVNAGAAFSPNESVEIRLIGAVGVLTAGSSTFAGGDGANAVTYDFDDDLVLAGTASVKLKF